jgi:NAD(P) transhydrogenase subunit beta
MAAGFAGIENHLFYKENTRMLFGDAKTSLNSLVSLVRAG